VKPKRITVKLETEPDTTELKKSFVKRLPDKKK